MTSIIISHKLNEIAYVADKITVIRDGSTIETLDKQTDDISEDRIIKGMVGRELTDRFPRRENINIGNTALEVRDWVVYHPLYSDRKVVDHVSIHVNKGEVVGICGLMGAGRTELAMSIFGKSYGTNISGQLFIEGKEVHLNTVHDAISHKIAYVTEDRKGNGLILSNPIRVNTTLANMGAVSSHGVIDKDKEYMVAVEYKDKLKTKCPGVEQNAGNLSGGNQQKVLLAKWMFTEPDILILDEPTNGIDPKGFESIRKLLIRLNKEERKTILISSHILEELNKVATSYGIMKKGKLIECVTNEELNQRCRQYLQIKVNSSSKASMLLEQMLSIYSYAVIDKNTLHIFDEVSSDKIIKMLVMNDIAVYSCMLNSQSLEEYFLSRNGGIE